MKNFLMMLVFALISVASGFAKVEYGSTHQNIVRFTDGSTTFYTNNATDVYVHNGIMFSFINDTISKTTNEVVASMNTELALNFTANKLNQSIRFNNLDGEIRHTNNKQVLCSNVIIANITDEPILVKGDSLLWLLYKNESIILSGESLMRHNLTITNCDKDDVLNVVITSRQYRYAVTYDFCDDEFYYVKSMNETYIYNKTYKKTLISTSITRKEYNYAKSHII